MRRSPIFHALCSHPATLGFTGGCGLPSGVIKHGLLENTYHLSVIFLLEGHFYKWNAQPPLMVSQRVSIVIPKKKATISRKSSEKTPLPRRQMRDCSVQGDLFSFNGLISGYVQQRQRADAFPGKSHGNPMEIPWKWRF